MENKDAEKIVYCRDCEVYESCNHVVGKWIGYCYESYNELLNEKIKDSRKDCEGD